MPTHELTTLPLLDTLPSSAFLFGAESAGSPAPNRFSPLAVVRAAARPYTTASLTAQAYTTVAGDIGKVLDVNAGASDATITLLSSATAGAGAEITIRKADAGVGLIAVVDGATLLAWLLSANDRLDLKSTGAAWEITSQASSTPIAAVPYISGQWYSAYDCQGAAAAITASDTIYLTPFVVRQPVSVQKIGTRVVTGQVGGALKAGVWRCGPAGSGSATGKPYGAPLIADNVGQAATATADAVYTLPTAVVLPAGLYWYGVKCTATTTRPSVSVASTAQNGSTAQAMLGASTLAAATGATTRGLTFAQAYATDMPTFAASDAFALSGSGVNHPLGAFQVA